MNTVHEYQPFTHTAPEISSIPPTHTQARVAKIAQKAVPPSFVLSNQAGMPYRPSVYKDIQYNNDT